MIVVLENSEPELVERLSPNTTNRLLAQATWPNHLHSSLIPVTSESSLTGKYTVRNILDFTEILPQGSRPNPLTLPQVPININLGLLIKYCFSLIETLPKLLFITFITSVTLRCYFSDSDHCVDPDH